MALCATISVTKSVISTGSNIACSRLAQERVAIDSDLTFGDWLRRQRRALDLTRAELAGSVGCSVSALRKFEADELRPSRPLAEALAGALQIAAKDRAAFVRCARDMPGADTTRLAVATLSLQRPTPRSSVRSSLPLPPTALIGREQECAALRQLLCRSDTRLVTLTGPGGVGKTRLGLQVAAELVENFADGVYFVDLAPIRDPQLVSTTIAGTLGVREVGNQPLLATLKDQLRDKRLLLLLDNFEHLLDAAPLVADLLANAAQLKVLATSREVLHLRGEQEVGVPPLAVPDPTHVPALDHLSQYAAVALFIQRVQAVQPSFHLTNANAPAVAEICARLDGLPLAIELAAARLKLFAPQALLARLSSRLALLTGGARDLPARQQTIRATIDWSYHLLDTDEQVLFTRLGVFAGGFTLEAAPAICNAGNDLPRDVIDGIASLLDKSLLQRMGGVEGEPRFTMLETIREYALERLAEREEVEALRQAHAAYYLALGQAAEPQLRRPQQVAWMVRLEQEHNNLRAVLAWSQSAAASDGQAGALGARLAVAVWEFWSRRGYCEGRRWLEGALSHVGVDPPEPEARRLRARTLSAAGNLAVYQGDAVAGRTLLEESLALFQDLGDSWGTAYVLLNLGLSYQQGDLGQAERLIEQSLAIFRTLGDRWGIAYGLYFLGAALAPLQGLRSVDAQDQSGRALVLLEESLAHFRAVGDLFGIPFALTWLGSLAAKQGDDRRARALLAESLALDHETGNKVGVLRALRAFAGLVAAQGQQRAELERAARLFGAAEALEDSMIANPVGIFGYSAPQHTIAMLRTQLGEATFAAAWAEGRAMTLEQAIAEALDGTSDRPIGGTTEDVNAVVR
jgi:predicted ATPase/transcriptional regulator with XRE-family HTH domain